VKKSYAGSRYIKLDDVHGKPPLREQIAVVKEEDGKFGPKLVLVFESGKQLSLSKTNVGILINDLDEDYETWIGQFLEIYAGEIRYQGGMMDAVLVRLIDGETPMRPETPAAPTSPTLPPKKAAATKPARGDMDDEIPF
jgi:hypothetical protein